MGDEINSSLETLANTSTIYKFKLDEDEDIEKHLK